MVELQVDLGERAYPVLIGAGLLGKPGLLSPYLGGAQAMVVTNKTVSPLFLDKLLGSLGGVDADVVELDDGERFKTLATYSRVINALMDKRHNRTTTLIALGGGVVGDIAGFAAATFQRGVPFIQAPTTLLAQVDSSVGGKTGVNHADGKNMIGAFHQPSCVVADIQALQTLPEREYRAGLAEVVKYGVIQDAEFFGWLEGQVEALLAREPATLIHAIRRSCEIKAAVVQADEREAGARMILNYGHTFGHALEAATQYRTLLHGEAVAIGMVMAAHLAERCGRLSAAAVGRIRGLLGRCGLPTVPPKLESDALLTAMAMDKKALGGLIRLVLPDAIGTVSVTTDIPREAILETLEAFRAQAESA